MATSPSGSAVCDCNDPAQQFALILYPSLGTPLLLGPSQKKCSIFIAAASLGVRRSKASKPTLDKKSTVTPMDGDEGKTAAATVARHLRLVGMKGPKPPTDVKVGGLTGDDKLCAKAREGAVEVWQVAQFKAGEIIYTSRGEVFATVSPQAVAAFSSAGFAGGFVYEVVLDLDKLAVKPTSDEFMSFAWMVEPTKQNKTDFPTLCAGAAVHAQDLLVEVFLGNQVRSARWGHRSSGGITKGSKESAVLEFDVEKTASSAVSLSASDSERLAAWHPVIRRKSGGPLKVGHLSDVHINVRHSALAKSPANVIETADFTKDNPAVGQKVCNTFNALKALIDTVGTTPDAALMLTGDLIDFNRNIDPQKVGSGIGEQWKKFNVLNQLGAKDGTSLYPRGQDDMLAYSLVRNAYIKHKLPVYMTTGNHEAYSYPYGVYPRVGVWGGMLGAEEVLLKTARDTQTELMALLNALTAAERDIRAAGKAYVDKAGSQGVAAQEAIAQQEAAVQEALDKVDAQSKTTARNAHRALDEYLREVEAGRPQVKPDLEPLPNGQGLTGKVWSLYHSALNSAKQGVADIANSTIDGLWQTYSNAVGAVGHSTISFKQDAKAVVTGAVGLGNEIGAGLASMSVKVGTAVTQARGAATTQAALSAVWVPRIHVEQAVQNNDALIASLEEHIQEHRKDSESASKFLGKWANGGIPADHNMTVYEATLAYGPTYGQTWTGLNFSTANFDWFGVLFSPLSDYCIALHREPQDEGKPSQILVGLAWGEAENFMNLGILKAPLITVKKLDLRQTDSDDQGMMILPRASASINEAQKCVLNQAMTYKRANGGSAPLVVVSHFTMINYNNANFSEQLSFIAANDPRQEQYRKNPAFTEANFGSCELNQKWYYETCAVKGGVDWHLSGHSHRSGMYTVKSDASAGVMRITVASRRDPGMAASQTLTAERAQGTQFVVCSSGGPIGVQNLAGELSGYTLRPPAGSLIDCVAGTVQQIQTKRTDSVTGGRHNEKPRLCVALDYLYLTSSKAQGDGEEPLRFEWAPRTGIMGAKKRVGVVKLALSEQLKKLDCIAGVRIWVFEAGVNAARDRIQSWHCLTPTLAKDKGGSGILTFSANDVSTLNRVCAAQVSTSMLPGMDGAMSTSIDESRAIQAFCDVELKKPTIQRGVEDWSADMNISDHWVFPVDIGSTSIDAAVSDFMRRRSGEYGQVPDWAFLAKYYAKYGYIKSKEAIDPDGQER